MNTSNTTAALNGETEQKFNSGHVSSKSDVLRDSILPSLVMEQEFIFSSEFIFSLEGLSSSPSHSLFLVGQSQPPHLAANSQTARPGASLKSVTFNISQQSKHSVCLGREDLCIHSWRACFVSQYKSGLNQISKGFVKMLSLFKEFYTLQDVSKACPC